VTVVISVLQRSSKYLVRQLPADYDEQSIDDAQLALYERELMLVDEQEEQEVRMIENGVRL